ncbi:MAG TPA: bifunctional oligoribonuclease/PAP phosphatase NrnA [Anaerolineaceae bacterium]
MRNNGASGGSENAIEPQPSEVVVREIRELFEKSAHMLVVSHIRPDGDAIGATLGLGLALMQAGKDVRMVLADGLPPNFRHMEGGQLIRRSPGDLTSYDCVVVVDCSDLVRTGGILGERVPDLNIDHHITNLNFARVNLVLPQQVATSAIIAQYLSGWGLSYNRSIAAALLTGIVTDTIGFRTSNVTPEALRLSAMLMEQGADLPDLYTRALASKTYEAARYWGYGLGKLQKDDNLVWTALTLEDRRGAEYPGNDDADLVNLLSSIDSDVAIIFVEQKNGHVKVSWRSRPGIDVSQIALQFGGGGHAAAAGADISGSLQAIEQQVLTVTREFISQASKNGQNGKD